jgi:hypothetical protein
MDNDFDNDFESTDFESEAPESTTDSISETRDTNDLVTSILMGEDAPAESKGGKSFSTRDVDGDTGKPRYEGGEKEAPSYAGNQSAPDMQSAQARINHFNNEGERIQRQWQELQEMQSDLTPEQFAYQQQFLQGQAAATVMQQQQAQIELMNNQQWLAQQEAAVREKHADIFSDPQKREVYSRKMIDYLGSIGYSREELQDISAREYNAVLDHIKVTEERDQLKLQVAKLKQERRAHQGSLKKGRRDMQAGSRGSKGSGDVYDEVARIITGGGK